MYTLFDPTFNIRGVTLFFKKGTFQFWQLNWFLFVCYFIHQISSWRFLIHLFFYAGVYCNDVACTFHHCNELDSFSIFTGGNDSEKVL